VDESGKVQAASERPTDRSAPVAPRTVWDRIKANQPTRRARASGSISRQVENWPPDDGLASTAALDPWPKDAETPVPVQRRMPQRLRRSGDHTCG
jgi:hypothetical protein